MIGVRWCKSDGYVCFCFTHLVLTTPTPAGIDYVLSVEPHPENIIDPHNFPKSNHYSFGTIFPKDKSPYFQQFERFAWTISCTISV